MENILKNSKKLNFSKDIIKSIPQTPGIYIFIHKTKDALYVGKSINLRDRVYSYLSNNLIGKTRKMVSSAKYITCIKVNSELESLLLEAKLIQYFKPPFNIQLKDDKQPIYIRITNELYPRVLTARKIDEIQKNIAFYGPFPSKRKVISILKYLRKVFPYSNHKLGIRPCIYSQIGLCNPCPNYIESQKSEDKRTYLTKIYNNNIRFLKLVFDGKLKRVKNDLIKDMNIFSENNDFESAINVRHQIENLEYVAQPITNTSEYIKNPNLSTDLRMQELDNLKTVLRDYFPDIKTRRIECYDISHISGAYPAGSMVTFIDGEPNKNLYRQFKIQQNNRSDDYSSMMEVALRRSKYFIKWGKPDLIIVDGGKPQLSAFLNKLVNYKIPLIGIAKKYDHLIIPNYSKNKTVYTEISIKNNYCLHLIQRARDEAHRFAKRYHHKLVELNLINTQ